jgi:hypothetical protein
MNEKLISAIYLLLYLIKLRLIPIDEHILQLLGYMNLNCNTHIDDPIIENKIENKTIEILEKVFPQTIEEAKKQNVILEKCGEFRLPYDPEEDDDEDEIIDEIIDENIDKKTIRLRNTFKISIQQLVTRFKNRKYIEGDYKLIEKKRSKLMGILNDKKQNMKKQDIEFIEKNINDYLDNVYNRFITNRKVSNIFDTIKNMYDKHFQELRQIKRVSFIQRRHKNFFASLKPIIDSYIENYRLDEKTLKQLNRNISSYVDHSVTFINNKKEEKTKSARKSIRKSTRKSARKSKK